MKKLILSAILFYGMTTQATQLAETANELMELKRDVITTLEDSEEKKSCLKMGEVYDKAVELKHLQINNNVDPKDTKLDMERAQTFLELYCDYKF
jgi:hypothetical protein